MIWKIVVSAFVSIVIFTTARGQVAGIVFDQISRKPLAQVDLINLANQEKTSSNAKGEFAIKANVNDVLVFKRIGYQPDTVLVINLKPMRRYMTGDKNMLKTVVISDQRTLKQQYSQAFNKANPILLKQGRGLLFYPSTLFSREGRQARYFVRMLKREEKEKVIDRRFNLKSISALVPLKQPELDAFLVLYRPSLKFINRVSADDFKSYVLDCYRKFKLLPQEQRILPSLK